MHILALAPEHCLRRPCRGVEIDDESALRAGVRGRSYCIAGAARVVSFEAKADGYWVMS